MSMLKTALSTMAVFLLEIGSYIILIYLQSENRTCFFNLILSRVTLISTFLTESSCKDSYIPLAFSSQVVC